MQLQPHHVDQIRVAALRFQQDNAAKLEAVQLLALTAEPAPQFTLQGLFDLWVKVSEPKVCTQARCDAGVVQGIWMKLVVGLSENPSLGQVTQQSAIENHLRGEPQLRVGVE